MCLGKLRQRPPYCSFESVRALLRPVSEHDKMFFHQSYFSTFHSVPSKVTVFIYTERVPRTIKRENVNLTEKKKIGTFIPATSLLKALRSHAPFKHSFSIYVVATRGRTIFGISSS